MIYQRMKEGNNMRTDKKVSFNNIVAYTGIEKHQDWTFDERSSVWYTRENYRSFAIEEYRQKIKSGQSTSSIIKYDKVQRMNRIRRIRSFVIKAQGIIQKKNMLITKEDNNKNDGNGKKQHHHDDDNNTKWLAELYHHHSKSCAVVARQRGLDNDMWLLNVKLQEAASILMTHSKLLLSNNNNDRLWSSSIDDGKGNIKRPFSDVNNMIPNNNNNINDSTIIVGNVNVSHHHIRRKIKHFNRNPIFSPTSGTFGSTVPSRR
jgi:hypothetical protein